MRSPRVQLVPRVHTAVPRRLFLFTALRSLWSVRRSQVLGCVHRQRLELLSLIAERFSAFGGEQVGKLIQDAFVKGSAAVVT